MAEYGKASGRRCAVCGRPLARGAFGLQCLHCLLELGTLEGEILELAELFPELDFKGTIACGGFGTVLRAEHRRMKRPVALKLLDLELTHSPEVVALFQREMVVVAALDHPGIARAYDAGERDGRWFIIMELVDGEDCGALLRRHARLPVAESCEIIRQASLALDHTHSKGLVHRDIKPGNLMLARPPDSQRPNPTPSSPTVKVLDFGLAGFEAAALADATESADDTPTDGRLLGTLEYMAPEQLASTLTVDARADIYALGATLRRLLTGLPVRPGMGERTLKLGLQRIITTPVVPMATLRPDLPVELRRLCDRLLAMDRNERPASAANLATLLEPWCADADLARLFAAGPLPEKPFAAPKPDRRRRLWLAGATLAAIGALAVARWLPDEGAMPGPPTASSSVGRPVFSQRFLALRQLDASSAPRFISDQWELESETPILHAADGAQFRPGGDLAFRHSEPNGYRVILSTSLGFKSEQRLLVGEPINPHFVGVAPDTGHMIWDQRYDTNYQHLGRAKPDGTKLPSLTFDPAGDFDPSKRFAMRAYRLKYFEEDQERRPAGFAFVTKDNLPENTGLRAGDVLIADEAHRWIAPRFPPIIPDIHGLGALWRCRFDNDQPAQRLGQCPTLKDYPLGVTVARSGVFLLNRDELVPAKPISDADRTRRLLRWDLDGFHACALDTPICDPSGIAADPLSTDLYVIEGAAIPSANPAFQRLLRLTRTGPDQYEVRIVAERFGKFGVCGLSLTPDGRRMVLTDTGNRVLLVLKRQ